MRIDLHTHSTASDGTLPPDEVMAAAHRAGLDAVALTDHDSVDGWDRADAAANRLGIQLVPGVEMSCRWYEVEPAVPLHLLAYYVDPVHAGLAAEMARIRQGRERRAEKTVEVMRADGVDVTYDEVRGYAAGGTIGRPHLAQALVVRGLAGSVGEAFAPSMLGRRWRLPKPDTEVFAALRLVIEAGGVPVFAHPRATKRGRVVPDELIEAMAGAGLAGLEAEHEDHTPEQRAQVRALAARLGLVVTGSSDFHGANKTVAIGANLTSPEVLDHIRAVAAMRKSAGSAG
jgi:3',5'-nucleoside bisphosphate phosphatase